MQDIRLALRMFRNSPGFVAMAVVALTLGIGVNAGVFSVVDAVLLKPLGFTDGDRLVYLVHTGDDGLSTRASPANFVHWQEQNDRDVFEEIAAWRNAPLNYEVGNSSESVLVGNVSKGYFRMLRAPIVAGRGFSAEDDRPGALGTAVISERFWRQQGGRADIGKTISLRGHSYTVIGVVGKDFDVQEFGNGSPDIWVPLQLDLSTSDQDDSYLQVVARLKNGISLEYARQRIAASMASYRERYPDSREARDEHSGFSVARVRDVLVSNARPTLLVLLGAVSLVLLIACANVASLLLVRATVRQREMAIRSALGAGQWRIVRLLMTESVMLAVIGGALGLGAGLAGVHALLSLHGAGLPRIGGETSWLGLDWRVIGFTFGLSMLTGMFFGLVPALAGRRADLNSVLKQSGNRSGSGFAQNKTRSILIMTEIALAAVLLIGAGLLVRTSLALSAVDLGFSADNVLTMRMSFSDSRFSRTAGLQQAVQSTLARIRSMPGVEAAASACCVPLRDHWGLPFNIIGRPIRGPKRVGAINPVSLDYFATLKIPLLAGRGFNKNDDSRSVPVAIINQAMAKQYWTDGSNPLHDMIKVGVPASVLAKGADEPPRRIIGIVGNIHSVSVASDAMPTIYLPQAQLSDGLNALIFGNSPMAWLFRTSLDAQSMSVALQNELSRTTGLPITDVELMEDTVSASTSRKQLDMWLMSIFAGSALLLAAVGVYGLIAYSVEQRKQEIGIRMALGAQPESVSKMIVREGLVLLGGGLVAGFVSAYFLAYALASILFGVEPHDLTVFVTVAIFLTSVSCAAIIVPAMRASRVDPLEALRYQ